MSEKKPSLGERLAAQKNQPRQHVPTSQTMAQAKEEMGRLTIYMSKAMVSDLKKLAWDEETSVSKIIVELAEDRLAAGPRTKEEPQVSRRPNFDV